MKKPVYKSRNNITKTKIVIKVLCNIKIIFNHNKTYKNSIV